MKKLLFLVLLLTLFLMLISCDDAIFDNQGLKFYQSDDGYVVEVEDAKHLRKISIPKSYKGKPVVGIADKAFEDCERLEEIELPSSVKTIGKNAFSGCNNLKRITVPNSVTSIDNNAFSDCAAYIEIHISDLSAWCGISFGNAASKPAGDIYLNGELLTNLVIPDGITVINPSAFRMCTGIENVIIPVGVTSIGDNAFRGCEKLTNVTIPDGVTSIGNDAFRDCEELTSIIIPGSVTSLGDRAFRECERITDVTILSGIKSIGNGTFGLCTSLTDVTIPDSVTSIGDEAFIGCEGLTGVTMSESVESIGEYAFSDCKALTSVTIPDSVKSIGECAFKGCAGLKSVTVGNGVTSIDYHAFSDCEELVGVYITDIAAWLRIGFGYYDSNPLSSAGNLYLNGELVTDLVIPDGVETVGFAAFYLCTSLTSVTIPKSVTRIDAFAFECCYKLVEVTNLSALDIDDGSMGNGSVARHALNVSSSETARKVWTDDNGYIFFEDGSTCYLLGYTGSEADLVLPESCNGKNYKIYDYAFYNRDSLTGVTVPRSVTAIGDYAFADCYVLDEIKYRGTEAQWGNITKSDGWDYDAGNYTLTYNYDGE